MPGLALRQLHTRLFDFATGGRGVSSSRGRRPVPLFACLRAPQMAPATHRRRRLSVAHRPTCANHWRRGISRERVEGQRQETHCTRYPSVERTTLEGGSSVGWPKAGRQGEREGAERPTAGCSSSDVRALPNTSRRQRKSFKTSSDGRGREFEGRQSRTALRASKPKAGGWAGNAGRTAAASRSGGVARLRVVFVSTEVAPWSKVGGLADFTAALPKQLARKGHAVMTVAPMYQHYHNVYDSGLRVPLDIPIESVVWELREAGRLREVAELSVDEMRHAALYMCTRDGVVRVFVDHPLIRLLGGGIYTYAGSKSHPWLDVVYSLLCQAALAAPVMLWGPSGAVPCRASAWLGTRLPTQESASLGYRDRNGGGIAGSDEIASRGGTAEMAADVRWNEGTTETHDNHKRRRQGQPALSRKGIAEGTSSVARDADTIPDDTIRGGAGEATPRRESVLPRTSAKQPLPDIDDLDVQGMTTGNLNSVKGSDLNTPDYNSIFYKDFETMKETGDSSVGDDTTAASEPSHTASEFVPSTAHMTQDEGKGRHDELANRHLAAGEREDAPMGKLTAHSIGTQENRTDETDGGDSERLYGANAREQSRVWDYTAAVADINEQSVASGSGGETNATGRKGSAPHGGSYSTTTPSEDGDDLSSTSKLNEDVVVPPISFVANDWPSAPLVLWLKYHYRRLNDTAGGVGPSKYSGQSTTGSSTVADIAEGLSEDVDTIHTSIDSAKTATTPFSRFSAIPKPSLRAVWDKVAKGLKGAKIAFCLHNGLHQGIFGKEAFPRLRLPTDVKSALQWPLGGSSQPPSTPPSTNKRDIGSRLELVGDRAEEYRVSSVAPKAPDTLNWLAAALLECDLRLTVSPGYAVELQSWQDEDDFIPARAVQKAGGIRGILNGIDTTAWDPSSDSLLPPELRYSVLTASAGKQAAKVALQGELGLRLAPGTPLVGFVGRMDSQKGVDVLFSALPELIGCNPVTSPTSRKRNQQKGTKVQVVMLGVGERWLEVGLEGLSRSFPGAATGTAAFDERLAHLILAASDYLVVPSRSEPCGLVALAALRYGVLPIVRPVGGLKDIVQHEVNGLHMVDVNEHEVASLRAEVTALLDVLRYAVQLYGSDHFFLMRESAMETDVSWDRAAENWEAALAGMMTPSATSIREDT